MFEDTFSKRRGYIPAPVQGERESLSADARRRLWDLFYLDFYKYHVFRPDFADEDYCTEPAERFLTGVWTEIFRKRIDERRGFEFTFGEIRRMFERGAWYFVFDVWEEIFKWGSLLAQPEYTAQAIRNALERENTAYTFVGGHFVDRMTPQEVQSIEEALASPIDGIREHFATALQMLTDRTDPDYRNSIKESISAVEAACKHLTGLQGATLGAALTELHKKRPLHPKLKESLHQLYGWTSDAAGIRHAIKDTSTVERADAQFMLVTCSAFVNYLFER